VWQLSSNTDLAQLVARTDLTAEQVKQWFRNKLKTLKGVQR